MGDVTTKPLRQRGRLAFLKPLFGGIIDLDVGLKELGRKLSWEKKLMGVEEFFVFWSPHHPCFIGAMGEGHG